MTASGLSGFRSELASRYVVEREIGRGGMATVYLARDVRHDRMVALKVLDPELGVVLGKERFLTEIRVTANLHHPHLLPLYDSGEADGQLFYVMPLVEGESLRERLAREKQLSIDDALRIATAVGAAVDYAHRHGVIHRDLKPENILLQDGQPFVADFGIALAVTRAGGTRITRTGLSLGTPQYTSPEQAAGDREVDGRTDVYSLGAVVYEMVAGEPPHTGSTAQAIIRKVITEEPRPLRLCRPGVPRHLELAVDRALAKVPGDRFATAQEFVDALRAAPSAVELPRNVSTPGSVAAAWAPVDARRRRWLGVVPWLLVASLAIALTAVSIRDKPAARPKAVRFELALSDSVRLRTSDGVTIALSHDGTRLAYAGGSESSGQLYVRDLGSLVSVPIRGTERARTPVFSPDDRSLLFSVDGRLKRVDLDGGAPVALTDSGGTASWSEAGILVARTRSLYLVPATGGPARQIATADSAQGMRGLSWPWALPGGKAALITIATTAGRRSEHVGVVRFTDGAITDLGVSGVNPRYLPTGHVIFATHDGTVHGMAFDVARGKVTGPVVPLLEDVVVKNGAATEIAVSDDGTLVYRSGKFMRRVLLVDRRGVATPLLDEPREYTFPTLSPDGTRIALTIGASTATSDTWVFDTRTGALTRLTRDGGERPEWTPDGRSVITVRSDTGTHLMIQSSDGSGSPRRYSDDPRPIWEVSLPRAGRGFLAVRLRAGGQRDIAIAPVDSPSTLRRFVATEADETSPSVSPDGRWLAYVSNESGRYEVYVREMPGDGPRIQVSTGGAVDPLWSPTGRELFYRANGKFVSARITWRNGVARVQRDALFDDVYGSNPNAHVTFSVMPDGNHFVFVQPTDGGSKTIVVLNWFDEVRRRMAAARSR